jgi:hypothetical protein
VRLPLPATGNECVLSTTAEIISYGAVAMKISIPIEMQGIDVASNESQVRNLRAEYSFYLDLKVKTRFMHVS